MTAPRIPFFLALAGALPLVYAALLNMGLPPVAELQFWLPYWDDGAGLMLNYSRIILVFMAGVLWGFATLSTGKMTLLVYGLSVAPALYVFFYVHTLQDLLYGFGAVFVLDLVFWRLRLAPPWWLGLRLPLTIIVCACLWFGAPV
ncbi:DUF3429 domain-containing protein [Paracoccaceae bacterium]|nr:DUF3429 domain-containing protein [Paracoccaceae bacterium]